MYTDRVSQEPLVAIRLAECPENPKDITTLAETRFRRLFNELETSEIRHGKAMDELIQSNASCNTLATALVMLKDEMVKMLVVNEERTGIRYKDGPENIPVVKQAVAAIENENERRQKVANDPESPTSQVFNMQLCRDAHGNIGLQFNRATAQFMLPPAEATKLAIGILQACGHSINTPNPGPGGGKKTPGGLILPN